MQNQVSKKPLKNGRLLELFASSENSLALFFWLYACLNFPYKIARYGFYDSLWYCDFALLFASIAFVFKKPWIYSALLAQCIMLQLMWLGDATLFSVAEIHITSESDYLFTGKLPTFDLIMTLRHFIIIPALLYALTLHKFSFPILKASIFQAVIYIIVQGSSLLFSNSEQNVSCAFKPCWEQILGWKVAGFESLWLYQVAFMATLQVGILVIGWTCYLVYTKIPLLSSKRIFYIGSLLFAFSAFALIIKWWSLR